MTRILRTAWGLPAAPGAPLRVWQDWALVGILVALALLETFLRADLPWRWPTLVIELGVIATLLWRRTRPGLMAVIAFGTLLLVDTIRQLVEVRPTDSYVLVAMLILIYALSRWGSGRALIIGGGVIALSVARSFVVAPANLQNLIGGIAVVTVSVAFGAAFRYRAAARTQRLAQVRLEERERLARDLHDTVAHHVSAIAVRAQAGLLVAETDPEAADDALRVIANEASLALREMRSIVRMLRDDETAERSPAVGAADLYALASNDGEPPVIVTIHGELDTMSRPIVTAAYRLVQESITNARRHARGATSVDAAIVADAAGIGIRVHDDGRPGSPRPGGFGIAGMTERATLLGGNCTSAPDPAGGWTVTARLPRDGSPR